MNLHVRYMAQLQAALGQREEQVTLPEGSRLSDLIAHLAAREGAQPHLLTSSGQVQPSLLIVVNDAAVPARETSARQLQSGDVVTLLPPIAGG